MVCGWIGGWLVCDAFLCLGDFVVFSAVLVGFAVLLICLVLVVCWCFITCFVCCGLWGSVVFGCCDAWVGLFVLMLLGVLLMCTWFVIAGLLFWRFLLFVGFAMLPAVCGFRGLLLFLLGLLAFSFLFLVCDLLFAGWACFDIWVLRKMMFWVCWIYVVLHWYFVGFAVLVCFVFRLLW